MQERGAGRRIKVEGWAHIADYDLEYDRQLAPRPGHFRKSFDRLTVYKLDNGEPFRRGVKR
jgi:hypothetical protein